MLLLEKYSGEYLRLNFHGHVGDVLLCTASSAVSLGRSFPFKASVEKICASICPFVYLCFLATFSIGTFVSAFTVLCGARTDLPDRHICCVFWLNIAAALIQILTAIVMVGWIMSIFWGMDMVILASKYSAISIPSALCC
uniref:Stum, mechanosensory transduction mediator homolog n=1 Tax=Meleagris gallopavo TaxID=9103 RepID=A0A803XUG1_MELGA